MQSKIRIEYDFETKQPVLRITQSENSDDLRDQMLKAFIQKAGWENSKVYLHYPEYTGRSDNNIIEFRCEEVSVQENFYRAKNLVQNQINNGFLNADQSSKIDEFFRWLDKEIQLTPIKKEI